MNRTRRALLRASAASLALGAGCAGGGGDDGTGTVGTDGGTAGSVDGGSDGEATSGVAVEPVATGFTSPVGFETPAGVDRRFVVDQPGVIYEVRDGGARNYLDLRERVVDVSGYSERGLLGLAFHPDFSENGRLFVRYSAPRRDGTPQGYSHTFVLSEFRADPAAGAVALDAERTLLEIPEPQSNHNSGALAFDPDGLLYVGVGDGGGANDTGTGHVADWYDANPGGNGQDVSENLLGSVLRIDVDSAGDGRSYGVPDDNPLVGSDGPDEQYAWGFRNPWRFSVRDGALLVADVGQGAWEEVDLVERGGNYGWNVREGAHCFRAESCPTETPDGAALRPPVIEYPHRASSGPSGIAVVGGYVAPDDGPVPALRGRYVFADWRANGRLFVADPASGADQWPTAVVDAAGPHSLGDFVLAFGFDGRDVFVCSSKRGGVGGSTGAVHRLVPGE